MGLNAQWIKCSDACIQVKRNKLFVCQRRIKYSLINVECEIDIKWICVLNFGTFRRTKMVAYMGSRF